VLALAPFDRNAVLDRWGDEPENSSLRSRDLLPACGLLQVLPDVVHNVVIAVPTALKFVT
jgi:hypothetical protein